MHQKKMVIGIDLGGTKMRVGIVDDSGKVLEKVTVPTSVEGGAPSIIATLVGEITKLQQKFIANPTIAIGVAVAGQIQAETGVVRFSPNLHWQNVPLGQNLQEALKLPVYIANDVRAATHGEWHYGAAQGLQDFICLFVGTGIGGGIVSGGVLMSGCNNSAGEIGHMVIASQGKLCTCGNRGCWETQAAGWGIAKLTQEAIRNDLQAGKNILAYAEGDLTAVNAQHLFKGVVTGDPMSINLMQGIEKALIDGSTSLVNVFNPQSLIFGGGIIEGAPWLLDAIDAGVRKQALKSATEKLKIAAALNVKDAAIIGIAAMAKAYLPLSV